MKILVTQFYTGNVSYAKYSTEINKKYCEQHQYEYFIESDTEKINKLLNGRSTTWYKPHLLIEAFEKYPDMDYYLYLDIDAVFSNHEKQIEDFIDSECSILMTQDYGPSLVNAGVMLVKNDSFSKKFIVDWWNICEEYPLYKTGLWHDQTCIGLLYEKMQKPNEFKIIPTGPFNSSTFGTDEFIFHAFSFGQLKNRSIDSAYYRLFNIEPEFNNPTLMDLAEVYSTDKHYLHNYFQQVYQEILEPIQTTAKDILEIGVLDGNTLRIFKRFFKNAKIYGADIVIPSKMESDITVYKTDQSSRLQLTELGKQFETLDLILDDGSHKMYDQQITLATMFKKLKSGGLYILEDLHTSIECLMPEKAMFGWGDATKTTTLQMLENFKSTGKIISDYLSEEECKYLEENIEVCEIFYLNDKCSITSYLKKL